MEAPTPLEWFLALLETVPHARGSISLWQEVALVDDGVAAGDALADHGLGRLILVDDQDVVDASEDGVRAILLPEIFVRGRLHYGPQSGDW